MKLPRDICWYLKKQNETAEGIEMKQIERITFMDTMQGKGKDIVFVIENGRIIAKHIEDVDWEGFGEVPYAG